jgi:hypothetical protein
MRNEISALLHRFHHFDDGLITSFALSYHDGKKLLEIVLNSRDHTASTDSWCEVRIHMMSVIEYCFREQKNTTLQVLSSGMRVIDTDQCVGLEFGDIAGNIETLAEMRGSGAYAIATDISFSVSPID